MKSKWRKAKLALGLNLCYYVPKTLDEEEDSPPVSERFSGSALLTHAAAASGGDSWSSVSLQRPLMPSSPRLKLTRSSSKSTPQKKICSICLATMKPGEGHAIFTAECSHSFHFHCITSSVKYGNQVCPVCRAKWKEIPIQGPTANQNMPGINNPAAAAWSQQDDGMLTLFRRLPSPRRHTSSPIHSTEPALFNDDESLGQSEFCSRRSAPNPSAPPSSDNNAHLNAIEIKTYPEVSSVQRSKSHDNFTVLIHLKAPVLQTPSSRGDQDDAHPYVSRSIRTPVDLVTVLDISGSMAGTKLALLKRAMGFVIQNLSSNDRLSVIAFSSTARRLFPLSRMSEVGRQQALQAVNSLVANGGTNIAEGLRKGAKVMEERRERNPVASIILLSDGQDTYTVNEPNVRGELVRPNYKLLLPLSIQGKDQRQQAAGFQIPIHTFGFGTDHDSSLMHSVSEISGGTFSFIETEAAIQDAFAQCIGGLLSVVVQKLQVGVECIHPSTCFISIKAGSYPSSVTGRSGSIEVGDLYADEERDFLVCMNIPPVSDSVNKTSLLRVTCTFMDPFTKEMVTLEGNELEIVRTTERVNGLPETVSLEVDRQQNRLRAAEAMSQARSAAELGELESAISILEDCRKMLGSTESAKRGDKLCVALNAELKEMQERMVSRRVYEASGRAYILSGLSSHSWQRATARGDSTDSSSLIQAYQTPSMVEMLSRSHASLLGSPVAQRLLRPSWSFGSPKPR